MKALLRVVFGLVLVTGLAVGGLACSQNCGMCKKSKVCSAKCTKPCCKKDGKCPANCNKPCCKNKGKCPANCQKPCCKNKNMNKNKPMNKNQGAPRTGSMTPES